jgi:DNA (cytosine-5)-methyltransferase 1
VTVGSLFAGIGGFDLGLERAGMEVKWQVEIDPFCRAVLAKHWPDVRRYEDVRTVGSELEWVDVLCGGWPCQPVSSASRGRRRGTADHRWLWPANRRVIALKRPTWFVGENVAHLDGASLEQVVSDLEALDYEVAPPLEVPACAFGHDHWRRRLWFLCHTNRNGQSGVPVDAEVAGVPWVGDDAGGMGATHGVSRRLDACRMAALGNAIVPQIAEWIGRRILEAEALRVA